MFVLSLSIVSYKTFTLLDLRIVFFEEQPINFPIKTKMFLRENMKDLHGFNQHKNAKTIKQQLLMVVRLIIVLTCKNCLLINVDMQQIWILILVFCPLNLDDKL